MDKIKTLSNYRLEKAKVERFIKMIESHIDRWYR